MKFGYIYIRIEQIEEKKNWLEDLINVRLKNEKEKKLEKQKQVKVQEVKKKDIKNIRNLKRDII